MHDCNYCDHSDHPLPATTTTAQSALATLPTATVAYTDEEGNGTHVKGAGGAASTTGTDAQDTSSYNATGNTTRPNDQEQGGEPQVQQQEKARGRGTKSVSVGLAVGIAIIAILLIAAIGVAIAVYLPKSKINSCGDDDGNSDGDNAVQAPEIVEVVQNPAFDHAAGVAGSRAGSPSAGGHAGGVAGAADYLEPDSVQPAVYEGAERTRQRVAAGDLALDLNGYVVDEAGATMTAASSLSVVYATVVSLDLDGYVVDEAGAPGAASSPSVVYATAIDDGTSGKPAIVYAVPLEREATLFKTAAAADGKCRRGSDGGRACNNKVVSGSLYCTYHACTHAGCTTSKSSSNKACSVHLPSNARSQSTAAVKVHQRQQKPQQKPPQQRQQLKAK
eukprot:gene10474-18740_t